MREWISQIADAVDLINKAIETAQTLGRLDMADALADATLKLGSVVTAIAAYDAEPIEGRGFGPPASS